MFFLTAVNWTPIDWAVLKNNSRKKEKNIAKSGKILFFDFPALLCRPGRTNCFILVNSVSRASAFKFKKEKSNNDSFSGNRL
jgi:hypothetical protein